MPTDPKILSAFAANLDKQLTARLLQFAASTTSSAELKTQYSQGVKAIETVVARDAAEEVLAKAWQSTGPVKGLFFAESEEGTLGLKYVGKEYGEAVRGGKFNPQELTANKVKDKHVSNLCNVAFALVNGGKYTQALEVLKVYHTITNNMAQQQKDAETKRIASAAWGQFVSNILVGNTDNARGDLENMLRGLDEHSADQGNNARSMLLHWALFYWFGSGNTTALLDLIFFVDRLDRSKTNLYANVIQCLAPHLLRYVAVAAVLGKKKRSHLKRAARLLDAEQYQYSDVMTQFVVELCVKTDFNTAAALIPKCAEALEQDFFMKKHVATFVSCARQLVFEDQLRVRKVLSISTAATQLGMAPEKAELWLVDLIREAKIDATVDSVAGSVRVNVASSQKSVWQFVMDRLEAIDRHAA